MSYIQSELPNYNSNNLWLPIELKILTPFENRSCTSRGSARVGEQGRRRRACTLRDAQGGQRSKSHSVSACSPAGCEALTLVKR